jgi:hypothetical protein
MILELRALVATVVVALVSVALLFLGWQVVFPVFAVAYLAYRYLYYRDRIDPGKTDGSTDWMPGQLLEKTTLLFVALFAVTRIVLFPLLSPVWTLDALSLPAFDLTSLSVLIDQLVSLGSVWATVLVPLAVVSYAVGQFRVRLLGGVDSRPAAIRAALWETAARVPLYLAWAGLFVLGPIYQLWVGIPAAAGLPVPAAAGFSPVLGGVFPAVVLVGHLVPALVIGAYVAVSREKYGDRAVPEPLGYRGLYPPDRQVSTANLAVPGAVYLIYAAAVVVFVPLGSPVRAGLVLPALVAILVGADIRGLTSGLSRALPEWVPDDGVDAVVVGLCAGLGALALLAVGLGADPAAAMYFGVVAAPLTFGANLGLASVKASRMEALKERVEADPDALQQSEVDRLLAYTDARNDQLRAAAIAGLASAVWASSYRETEATAVFESVLGSEDERFARAGLRGVVQLFRADRGITSVGGLLEGDVFRTVVAAVDSEDAQTRSLAAEAFCRMVAVGYGVGRADDLLATLDGVPLNRVEAVVDEETDQHLTDAAVECFAVLWYGRNGVLGRSLTDDDERTLLVDLVSWSARASSLARSKAAFALTSDRAVTDAAGLDAITEYLDSEVALVRFMAAHTVQSSMDRHADRVGLDQLLSLLDDEYELVRRAGANSIQAYVRATGESEGVLDALLDHLEASDPAAADSADATVLATMELIDEATVTERAGVAGTVADYAGSENGTVAEPAAKLLATVVEANPERGREDPVLSALEAGLTHENTAVREHSARAAAAITADDPGAGRPFIRGLVLNLGTSGTISEIAASTLSQVLAEYPEYGTEFLPEMVGGLRNPTSISRQYAGAMVTGRTVSQVTARFLADITEYDTSRGDSLIGPLVDLASNTGNVARDAVFATLENLSADFPEQSQEALAAAQSALDAGEVRVRRNAAQILSNVALEYPESVAPMASRLIVAVDDSDPQMRSIALVTLGTIGAEAPEAIEADIRRIIGRLDDDSSLVREHAAKAIITVAQNQPDIVEPAAEASDRLRRIQRDPAVELDEEMVHQAANAIRTGTPPGEDVEASGDDTSTDIFTPEGVDEAGQSSDTRVFEPPTDGDGTAEDPS